jgi:hypothetical protein
MDILAVLNALMTRKPSLTLLAVDVILTNVKSVKLCCEGMKGKGCAVSSYKAFCDGIFFALL